MSLNALPQFTTIEPAGIKESLTTLLQSNQQAINRRLEKGHPFTWDNFILPIEKDADRLQQFWSPISHLHSVKDTPELRDAYNECLPLLSEYSTWFGQNVALYEAYKSMDTSVLDTAQQKVIENALQDFKLSGVALTGAARERYKAIQEELSKLQAKFEENILDSTDAWQHHVTDPILLTGIPEHALVTAHAKAQAKNLEGWLLTLDMPCYLAVVQYADNRELREKIYTAYQTRASELSNDGKFDNTENIEKILSLRLEESKLLSFKNFAECSLATKMAKKPEQVLELLQKLATAAKPFAQQELEELKTFSAQQGCTDLQSWDIAYYSEKLREVKFNINDEELRPYFPQPVVLNGMFEILKRLYGLSFKEITEFDRWHDDVKLFSLYNEHNTLLGYFYIDLYARTGKRSGAWMDNARERFKLAEGTQTPIAYLTCNFAPPVNNQPALFTHDDVVTLFHETGHCLQHLLTMVDYPEVAGINGVAWDAVELPSQFSENWCWSSETLPLISQHYQTGAPLPQEKLDKMLLAKNFQIGMQTLRQVEFALFDFRLHQEFDPQQKGQVQTILQHVRDEVSVFQPPKFTRFPNSFAHIFAGGYAAGYYSYKWAEVLSADAFQRFEQEGIFNPQTGREFMQSILATGGSRDAMDLFKQFRGREPDITALLAQGGML